jgi:hypothetical protein
MRYCDILLYNSIAQVKGKYMTYEASIWGVEAHVGKNDTSDTGIAWLIELLDLAGL